MSPGEVAGERIQQQLERCVRCGTCMAVCPVYEVMRLEGAVARGKLELIRALQQGQIVDDRRYRHFLTACLLCNRCRTACPNEVDTAALVQAARAELARRGRIGWWKRFALRRLLPSRRILPALIRGARATRVLWAAKVPADSGLHLRLMRGPGGARRRIPPLARPFFLRRPRPAAPATGPRVVLFVGCVNNYLRPQAAEAAVAVLRQAGATVRVPTSQGCCGLPAWGAGETDGALKLAIRNLDALLPEDAEAPEAVTSPCASCAYMLAHHLPELLAGDPDRAGRARALAERVVPFSRLWSRLSGVAVEGPGRQPGPGRTRITFHDPCHLSRGFGDKDAPRWLLTGLAGAQLVEMYHPCHCCGHGGSFNLAHYDLSVRMGQDKAERIAAAGVAAVVTECSGCVLHLAESLGRVAPGIEVLTSAEAALRFGASPEKSKPD